MSGSWWPKTERHWYWSLLLDYFLVQRIWLPQWAPKPKRHEHINIVNQTPKWATHNNFQDTDLSNERFFSNRMPGSPQNRSKLLVPRGFVRFKLGKIEPNVMKELFSVFDMVFNLSRDKLSVSRVLILITNVLYSSQILILKFGLHGQLVDEVVSRIEIRRTWITNSRTRHVNYQCMASSFKDRISLVKEVVGLLDRSHKSVSTLHH